MNLLSEDVTLWADGGGKIKQAALRPIRGRDAVARFSLGRQIVWKHDSSPATSVTNFVKRGDCLDRQRGQHHEGNSRDVRFERQYCGVTTLWVCWRYGVEQAAGGKHSAAQLDSLLSLL
jgi:hypothetical protein